MTTRKQPTRGRRTKAAEATTEPAAAAAAPTKPVVQRLRRARQREVNLTSATPVVGASRVGEPTTKVPPQPPFYFVYNRQRWGIVGGLLIPLLSKAKLMPGANGCGADRDQKPLPAIMLGQIEENGHQIIPWDVDGPGTSYLAQDPSTRGWYTRWERVYPGSGRIRDGAEEYARWVQSLIERGVIESCPVYVLEQLVSDYEGMVVAATNDNRRRLAEKYEADLAVIVAEYELALAEEGNDADPEPLPEADDDGLLVPTDPSAELGDPSAPEST